MLKEKFVISTLILIIGGAITKVLGMFIRIIMTRLVGLEGISLYMLIYPTFSLFMVLSQLSMPTAISKLVSEERYNNKNLISSSIPVILLFNIFLIILIFLIAPILANNFLKEPKAYLPIISIALVLPFDSISNLLRGYFFGKQKMFPHIVSHVLEQLIRLTTIIIITPYLLKINITYAVSGLVLANVVSEALSILIFFLFLPRDFTIKKSDLIPRRSSIKKVLDISIPVTSGRLISSIGYFLEPIILTFSLMLVGYSKEYITLEYGVISGYVMPLIMMPGFFTNAISSALLPVISKAYSNNNLKEVKRKMRQAISYSLIIGVIYTVILMSNPNFFLELFYNTSHGSLYLRSIAPFFLLYYIESPLAAILQAINKQTSMMWDNVIGIILRLSLYFVLSFFKIGMYPLLIATISGVFVVTTRHFYHIKKALKKA